MLPEHRTENRTRITLLWSITMFSFLEKKCHEQNTHYYLVKTLLHLCFQLSFLKKQRLCSYSFLSLITSVSVGHLVSVWNHSFILVSSFKSKNYQESTCPYSRGLISFWNSVGRVLLATSFNFWTIYAMILTRWY